MCEKYYHQRSWQYHIHIFQKKYIYIMLHMFIFKRRGPNIDPC